MANGDVRLDDISSSRLLLSQTPHNYSIFRDKQRTKVMLTLGM